MSVSGPSTTPLLTAFDHRRSCYNLTNGSTVPDVELEQVIKDCLNVVPSAFNTQTTRLVLLVGQHHAKLWEIIGSALLAKIGAERYAAGTEARIKGFAAAYGTILFCDDPKAVEGLKIKGGDLYGPKVMGLIDRFRRMLLTVSISRRMNGHISPTVCINTSCGQQ